MTSVHNEKLSKVLPKFSFRRRWNGALFSWEVCCYEAGIYLYGEELSSPLALSTYHRKSLVLSRFPTACALFGVQFQRLLSTLSGRKDHLPG